MSQSIPAIQEANRIAFIKDAAEALKKKQIALWLKANPEIGATGRNRFYKMVQVGNTRNYQKTYVNPPISNVYK